MAPQKASTKPAAEELVPFEDQDFSEFNVVRSSAITEAPETWDDAVALANSLGIEIEDATADNLGDGFKRVEKDELVNRECILLQWNFSDPLREKFGRMYLVARGITRDGLRFWFTDGSTGVAQELGQLTRRRVAAGKMSSANAGLRLPRGLTKSEYPAQDEAGNDITATTYHIAV